MSPNSPYEIELMVVWGKHGSIDGQIRLLCERMVGDGATAFFDNVLAN